MFSKNHLITGVTITLIGFTSLPVYSQTVDTSQNNQNAYIEGNDNEINQVINQYYIIKNPSRRSIRRRQDINQPHKYQRLSTNGNSNGNLQNSRFKQGNRIPARQNGHRR